MTLRDISNIRLYSQQIAQTKFTTPQEIVSWMGAMQAQDYAMAKWAVGIRLSGITDNIIESAIDKGEIVRTHLLRPTWHFVSSENIYWMLELTSPQIKRALRTRHKQLEFSDSLILKCNKLLEKAMQAGNHLTREEILSHFHRAKIATDNNRASHILLLAEMEGIVCSGVTKSGKPSYALLAERIIKTKPWNREESLEKLARKYFSSHCPATLKDFTWWSGLPVKDARNALEMIKSDFIPEKIEHETYWFTNSFSTTQTQNSNSNTYLLPAFDEFLISYKDRTASLMLENQKNAVSENGIFRPVIVIDGQVTGLWKRAIKNDKLIIETYAFRKYNKATKIEIEKAAQIYRAFLNRITDCKY